MTWIEAICRVLRDSPEPMHYAEIAERVVNQNLVDHKGSAPAAVAASRLSTHISTEHERALVTRVGRGLYTLANKPISDYGASDVIVSCFGMFWEREPINWRTVPQVLGMQFSGSDPVDFCHQLGVYLLYDSRGVIYVGRTTDRPLGRHLSEHTKDRLRTRWNRFSWFGLLTVDDSGSLGNLPDSYSSSKMIPTLEAVLIEALEPRQNRKRGDDMAAVEYTQKV